MNVEIGAEATLFPEKEYINGFSLQCGTEEKHLGKELRRLMVCQRRQLVKLLYPLNIHQLVCSQQAAAKLLAQVRRERVGLHAPDRR
jgi:hypothetical protein